MAKTTPFEATTNNLESFWMPLTANRQFKSKPRLFVGAKDMHYTSVDGRKVLDGTAGLWCVNAGHGREKIIEAVRDQVGRLDYAPAFQMGHPAVFEFAARLTNLLGADFDHVFFTNSGSEAVDTALKMAIAYHRARGDGTRQRLIGRERGYHGVGFGGISVGGIVTNRKVFGGLLNGVDHLPHTHNLAKNAFSRGQPEHGAELANELERIITLHDASNTIPAEQYQEVKEEFQHLPDEQQSYFPLRPLPTPALFLFSSSSFDPFYFRWKISVFGFMSYFIN